MSFDETLFPNFYSSWTICEFFGPLEFVSIHQKAELSWKFQMVLVYFRGFVDLREQQV